MAERLDTRLNCEEGTTLSELLVVMLLLGVVGAITTTGIVQGFDAQLDATNVADTLDGTRIATQRVRDVARGADEVCADSTQTSLVLWTDDDDDGGIDDGEIDIFELVTDAGGDDVFQRRTPLAGSDDEVQLIRDDIINSALFDYTRGVGDPEPTEQPSDLVCVRSASMTPGASRVRTVEVTFTVENPNPADPDLTTSTLVQLRNAGLEAPTGTAPTPDFSFTCPANSETCSFDASASTDSDGFIAGYEWDFDDGTGGSGETTSNTFPVGDVDYEVRLLVTDDDGLRSSVTKTVRPGTSTGNAKPVPDFTFTCAALQCDFDASTSTDSDGTIDTYAWTFGDGDSDTGVTTSQTYNSAGDYSVILTVTDNGGSSDSLSRTVTVGNAVMRVESLNATGTPLSGNGSNASWSATFTIQLSLTSSGDPGSGITISGTATGGNGANAISRPGSCSTDASGGCQMVFNSLPKQADPLTLTVTQINDQTGTHTYDSDQNIATTISVSPSQTTAEP